MDHKALQMASQGTLQQAIQAIMSVRFEQHIFLLLRGGGEAALKCRVEVCSRGDVTPIAVFAVLNVVLLLFLLLLRL